MDTEAELEIETCEACARAMLGERFKADLGCQACIARVCFGYEARAERAANRPKPPEPVDFSDIPERQQAMHERLVNWGRSCNGGPTDETAPMFKQAKSPQHWATYGSDTLVPVDRSDAIIIGRGVYYLPQPHMIAVQWYYVKRTSVMQGRKAVACTAQALAQYVVDARQMLINRGV